MLSYEISVLSIVKENGETLIMNGNYADFTVQGEYTVTFGVKELTKVKPVERYS